MNRASLILHRAEPDDLWKWSSSVLYVLLGLALVLILMMAWQSTIGLLLFSAALVGGVILFSFARNEVALLCAILAGFVVAARYEAGFQMEEVIYGLVYLTYLGYWYVSRLFFYRDRIFRAWPDWVLFGFLVYVTVLLPLTLVLGGEVRVAISEWLSISMLAFYFPVREVCLRRGDQDARKYVLFSMGFVAGFIAIRNFLDYRRGFQEAEYLWQIATGRVVMNEHVLMMAALITLTFLLFSKTKINAFALSVLFVLFSAAVVVGQSRALWVSFALGIAVIFLLVDRKRKIQILVFGLATVGVTLIIGYVAFERAFTLIVAGLVDRLFSLESAAAKDISLINRLVEMKAAWEYIKVNPIVGHGFGVPITYYSLVFEATRVNSFIHNGYVGVLFRHGLVGFILLYGFYFGSLWHAFRSTRKSNVTRPDYVVATAALSCLVAESLVANTQNPFATSDYTLIIAVVAALGSTAWVGTQRLIADRTG